MTAALGRALVLLALFASTAGAVVGFAAAARGSAAGWAWVRKLAYLFAGAMAAANAVMVYALLAHDFSVSYVASVGSRSVPVWVSAVSLWSSLEGSILFWGLVLGAYVGAATWIHRRDHPRHLPYAAAVWLACGAFFSFLIAGPAQPFGTVLPVPADGPGPNPLLQNHVLMAAHPPFLYLGYVGMTIPFGLASAALIRGGIGPGLLRTLRTWLILPWTFLTAAIVLGGWWAYEVLGWGGYWAWDPVENASLLPWLTATAALHSALVMERKGILKGWTLTLVMATFLLTVLGTFMTRSGVFNSVHSFTQSAIGPTLLAFLLAALLWSVALLARGADRLAPEGRLEGPLSREATFLVNNLLFALLTFTVLLGTVFPLVVEALQGKQMSVGAPYFERLAVPLGVALLFLMGVGPALPWDRARRGEALRRLAPPLAGGAAAAGAGFALGVRSPWTLLALAGGGYAVQVTLAQIWLPVRRRLGAGGARPGRALLAATLGPGRRRFAGYLAHLGVVVLLAAVAVSSTMGAAAEVELAPGGSLELGPYTLTLLGAEEVVEPHRLSTVARIAVARGGEAVAVMGPRMNLYPGRREPIGTPDVRTGLGGDLYLSVLNVDPDGGSVGLFAKVHPLVGWIWGAAGMMVAGGLLAVWPWRPRRVEVPAAAGRAPASLGRRAARGAAR